MIFGANEAVDTYLYSGKAGEFKILDLYIKRILMADEGIIN